MEDHLLATLALLERGPTSWQEPFRNALAQCVTLCGDEGNGVLQALNRIMSARHHGDTLHAGQPRRFVLPGSRTARQYATRIEERGEIETRSNRHDLLNALAWICYPGVKGALNALHARRADAAAGPNGRSRTQDAACHLDENGLLVFCADPTTLRWLREAAWEELFVTQRARFIGNCRVVLLGHGLAEKLLNPYKRLTGHALLVDVTADDWRLEKAAFAQCADGAVARLLLGREWSPRDLVPIPVLGIPGFCPANANEAFYADRNVFRTRSVP